MRNVRASGRDILLPPIPYLKAQAEMLGYIAAILVICALLFFFSKPGRPYRALGWAYLFFLAQMMLLRGKMYYVAPVYPMIFAAGAVWIDRATRRPLWLWSNFWVKPLLALGIFAVAAIYAPTALPVLSVPHFLAYEHALGIEQQKFEHTAPSVLPQIYADMFGWEEMTQKVAAYYNTLSPDEQRRTAIFANNYGVRRSHRLLRPPLRPPQVHRRPPVLLALGPPRLHRREHNRPRRRPRREHADQVRQLHHHRPHQLPALPLRRLAPHLPLPRLQVEPPGSLAQTKKLAIRQPADETYQEERCGDPNGVTRDGSDHNVY